VGDDATVFNLELTRQERQEAQQWLLDRGWRGNGRLIAIAPGSKQPVNSWPLEHFEKVGRILRDRFSCQVLVIGGPPEYERGETLVKQWGFGINAAGAFSPRGSAALLEQCDLLIGMDTGTTHLAAAVGTRCVALYSARNNPGRWHPLGPGHVILRKDEEVPCAGCMLTVCTRSSQSCVELISVDEVVTAATEVLNEKGRQR
jgi:ADP-heptose:LPS heptosyltransferase